ncbi:MAG: hypothetical protein LBM16_05295 [Clostridiales bacterium]|jgi:spore germination protein YaaH|nr:hypothetical protein [Clostridiales bacterium]
MKKKKNSESLYMSDSFSEKNRKRAERRRRVISAIVIFSVIFIIVAASTAYYLVIHYMPNFTHESFYTYYDYSPNVIYSVVGGEYADESVHPILREDELYMPVSFVKRYIDEYIFWDKTDNRLSVTTENKLIQMRTDELNYFINNEPFLLSLPVYSLDGEAFLPASLIEEFYGVTITLQKERNIAVFDMPEHEKRISEIIVKDAKLRFEPTIKSPVAKDLLLNENVFVFETAGENADFTKVRTEDGLIGYVRTSLISQPKVIPPTERKKEYTPPKLFDGKINLVFDQITSVEANSNESRRTSIQGLDVLSPTWFSFDREKLNGDIINIGDKGYVDWAHNQGYQVWALITDNFDYEVSSAVLTDTSIREHVARQLLTFVSLYDLDGINIDFEMVRETDAEYFIQFIRELAPLLHAQGAVLSVDMYVPTASNRYYNRSEVGKAADYIIVMAYDEHWSTSPVSGPVASIGFVERGITATLEEVPKEKILLGLPYYVRVWAEDKSTGEVSSSAYSMQRGKEIFDSAGAEFIWDDSSKSYYAEYTDKDGDTEILNRVWLEDERSIEEKLKLFKYYDLAGVAGWKRNLETEGVWALIDSYS